MSRVGTEVSSALFWHPFEGSVDKEPLFVQYNKYDAQSANTSDISWYIESPANGVLLDNEVWIKYRLVITDGNTFASSIRAAWSNEQKDDSLRASSEDNAYRTAFRFGCTLQKACQNIMLDINGTVMTYEFVKYHDAFNRLFIAQEESEYIFPCVGGPFDNGSHQGNYDGWFVVGGSNTSALHPGNDASAIVNTATYWNVSCGKDQVGTGTSAHIISKVMGDNHKVVNMGFTKRADYFEYLWRAGGSVLDAPEAVYAADADIDLTALSNAARYEDSINVIVYEKLAISPFHLYDNRDIKMSIPNIRTFSLTFQLHSRYKELMFRSSQTQPNFTLDWYTTKPQLLMRWYTPPPGYQIPKQITIPCTKILTYTTSEVSAVSYSLGSWPTSMQTFQRSNISLPAVPDLFILFLKRKIGDYTMNMPDDYNLSINSLQIDMEGNSGKLVASEPIHLWNMYRRHLRLYPCGRDDFDSWYKYHCIVPITASDLGVIKGAGMDNPIQLSISNLKYCSYHQVLSINGYPGDEDFTPETQSLSTSVAFDFHLVCVYDKYALTVTSDGSSALQLLRVNSMGTSTMPSGGNAGPSSLADIAV
jgi:hypothetical protein